MSERGNWIKVDAAYYADPAVAAAGFPGNVLFLSLLMINGRDRRDGALKAGDLSPLGLARLMGMTEALGRDEAVSLVEGGLTELASSGLIVMTEDGGATISGWDKWRPSGAERQRRYRERKRAIPALPLVTDSSPVTAGDVTGDSRSDPDQIQIQSIPKKQSHVGACAERVIEAWAKARVGVSDGRREGEIRGGHATGFSSKALTGVMKKIETRLRDDGGKADAVNEMCETIIVAMQTPLNDAWHLQNGKSLDYILHSAARLEAAFAAAKRAGVGARSIAKTYGVDSATMAEF